MSALKRFDTQASSALKHWDALRKGLNKGVSVSPLSRYDAKLKSITKDSRAAASAADKLNRSVSKPVNTAGLDAAIRKTRALGRTAGKAGTRPSAGRTPTDNVIPFPRRRRGGRGGFFDRVDDVDSVFDARRQVTQGWRDRYDSIKAFTDETTRLYRAQAQVRVIGLPETENQRLFEAARNVTTQVKGIPLADSTQNALDLVGALGDVNQTIRALPLAAKYKVGFETIFGDQFGPEQVNEQVRSSFKFLELTGRTQRGEGEMAQMLDVLSQINASTGGRVTPSDLLLMARRGNPAVQGLSTGGLRNLASLIEDMGAEQTGTAMMSLYQALVAGVMKQSAAERFDYYGLLDRSKIKFGKAQQIKRLMPGANLLGPLLQEDPLKAADLLVERFKAKGVDMTDDRAVQSELSVLFGNRNAFRLMNMLMTQRPQIMKEAGRSEQSKGVVSMYDQMKGDPLLKIKEAEAAWTNFKAKLGQPMLEVTAGVAEGLMPVAKFFAEHEGVTKWTAAVFMGGKALSGLVETASLVHRGVTGVAGWFAGTATESDRMRRIIDETTGSLGRAGTSFDTTAAKAGKLKGQLGAISAMSAIKLTIGLAAVGAGVEIISWIIEENKKRTEEENRRKAVLGASYEGAVQGRQLFTTRTEADKNREALETIATQSYDVIRMMPEFKRGIQPEYTQGGKFSIYEAATKVRTTQTALADPNVLARLIKAIEQGRTATTPEEGSRFKEILSIAFPEQFKVASNIIVEELTNATKPLADSFSNLRRPADELAPSLFRLRSALESTSGRIGSLKFEPPTYGNLFGPPPSPSTTFGSPNTGPKTLPFSSPLLPRMATGGVVERGGFVQVHDAEAIIPAKVTRRWKDKPSHFPSKASEPVPGALLRVGSAANALAYRLSSLQIEPPSFSKLLVPVPTVGPTTTTFGAPQPVGPRRLPFSSPLFPSMATGGVIERGGFVQVHDREAIVPARVTSPLTKLKQLVDDGGARVRPARASQPTSDSQIRRTPGDLSEMLHSVGGAGETAREYADREVADYSAFGAGSGGVHININVPPGARAADDPAALAQLVAESVEAAMRREAAMNEARLDDLQRRMSDPRRFRQMLGREEERRREIA